jgi:hypothetical protein
MPTSGAYQTMIPTFTSWTLADAFFQVKRYAQAFPFVLRCSQMCGDPPRWLLDIHNWSSAVGDEEDIIETLTSSELRRYREFADPFPCMQCPLPCLDARQR